MLKTAETRTELRKRLDKMLAYAENYGERRQARVVAHAYGQWIDHDNPEFIRALRCMRWLPPTIDEFLTQREYLGGDTNQSIMQVWPTLLEDIRAINPDVMVGEPPIHEALLGGATGTGKTALSHVTNLYQATVATCFRDVQRLYSLNTATPIVFMFQSVSQTVTKRVIFQPFRRMFTAMPYVARHVRYRKDLEQTLDLEGNITFVPALANVEAMVGQAIAGGMVDEANFMSVVSNSKRVPGARGGGGHYDQAEDSYRNITRRRQRSFTTKGLSFGVICTLSSTRYKNDFMDRRMDEVRKHKEKGVHLFRRKQYEVSPAHLIKADTKTFRLIVGSDRYPTRILKAGEKAGIDYPANAQVEKVPVHYLPAFKTNPDGALRDIVGVATDTISGFITQRHKIVDAVLEGERLGLMPWVDKSDVDRSEGEEMPQWNDTLMPPRAARALPRWIHIDLSRTKDRCGIAIIRLLGMQAVVGENNVVEHVPKFAVETVLTIKPSSASPIDPAEIRTFLMQLPLHYGFNIAEITYDGFDSRESVLALNKAGIPSRLISMDKTVEPYEYLRTALYQDRVAMVASEIAQTELGTLEHDAIKDKVDHPPKGTKDAADAICGAIYACSTSRHLRGQGGHTKTDGTKNDRARQRPQGSQRRKR